MKAPGTIGRDVVIENGGNAAASLPQYKSICTLSLTREGEADQVIDTWGAGVEANTMEVAGVVVVRRFKNMGAASTRKLLEVANTSERAMEVARMRRGTDAPHAVEVEKVKADAEDTGAASTEVARGGESTFPLASTNSRRKLPARLLEAHDTVIGLPSA